MLKARAFKAAVSTPDSGGLMESPKGKESR